MKIILFIFRLLDAPCAPPLQSISLSLLFFTEVPWGPAGASRPNSRLTSPGLLTPAAQGLPLCALPLKGLAYLARALRSWLSPLLSETEPHPSDF